MSRVGLGCMRLSTEPTDPVQARATIEAALDAGAAWLDTARSYASGAPDAEHNEALIARVLAARAGGAPVRVVTKCGMTRPVAGPGPRGRRWQPDGRASSILADARASAAALGRPPDVLLLHAPDPRVALGTSFRALLHARDLGLTRTVGLSNVSRGQLDAIERDLGRGAVASVEVALGAFDDAAARGGVVAWCRDRGVSLLGHSPFGGPTRADRLRRDAVLRSLAEERGVTVHELVLAYLLAIDPCVVAIPGARRPETAASAARAGSILLDEEALGALDRRFPGLAMARRPPRAPSAEAAKAEVVILMGLAGSGKTRLVERWVDRGYTRLNRDLVGGTLKGLAERLGRELAGGASRIVLDNTYLTRAARSEVVRIAHARSAIVRCVHLDTPPHEAQVNVVRRMLERHGALLGGADLAKRSKEDPNLFPPNAFHRMQRQLEWPSDDEGFASVETIPFAREHAAGLPSLAVPIELVLERLEDGASPTVRQDAVVWERLAPPGAPVLLFGWRPGKDLACRARATELACEVFRDRPVEVGLCGHAGGPPVCWCRPPMPGLWLAFAIRHGVDVRASALALQSPAHRTMARTLGLREVAADGPPRDGPSRVSSPRDGLR